MQRTEGQSINEKVQAYWQRQPCGTDPEIVREESKYSLEWSRQIEEYRYLVEPFIHSVAQFTRHRGKRILEIGVGAGTDHLQWARASADCYGVDLTDAAIESTSRRLALEGLRSQLQRHDAESLPFDDGFFDAVYSWGVIHHSEHPDRIIAEIHRVLRPGGQFIGMFYNRRSLTGLYLWIKTALLRGRPFRSFRSVILDIQSQNANSYTAKEVRELFSAFSSATTETFITPHERRPWPNWLNQFFPSRWGFYIAIRAKKSSRTC